VIGWLADLCRLAWGLLYWNFAKTRFRLRGCRERAPCQSPSDSGRAMETTCEASLSWHRQENFHRVCPLLKRTASGELRCSVNAPDVRPFWIRALLICGMSALALYLAATLGYFTLQRAIGIPVSLVTIAYPPHWPRIDLARSVYFSQRADRALIAGKIGDAENSLALAYSLDSTNYAAGFKLALLYQNAQPALSDELYAGLFRDHPSRRATTATAWYRALLLRRDFAAIIPLATTALSLDPAHEAAWAHAVLFALRHSPFETLEQLLSSSEIPPAARSLLQLESRTRSLPPAEARDALLRASSASPYFDYYRIARLIDLGFSADARALLRTAAHLSSRDRAAFSLETAADLDLAGALDNDIAHLLTTPTPAVCELLAVHLIRHPDSARLSRLFDALDKNPLPKNETGYGAAMALLSAAGVAHDATLFHRASTRVQDIAGARFHTLALIESFFFQPGKKPRIETILPALQPLSAEINYALLDSYGQTSPATAGDAPPPSSPQSQPPSFAPFK
jgi:hypothetical protein